MTTPTSQILAELADREAIKECLYRYCRGVDRLDADMLRSAYWPDAIDQHLAFKGTIDEFIDWSFPIMRSFDAWQHLIANVLMTIRGDRADVESYFYGYQRVVVDGAKIGIMAGGRYVDQFEKRGDEWRVADRLVVTDWFHQYDDPADWSQGMMGMRLDMGSPGRDDFSYQRLEIV